MATKKTNSNQDGGIVVQGRRTWRFSAKQLEVLNRNLIGDWQDLLKREPGLLARVLGLVCHYKADKAAELLAPYGIGVKKAERPKRGQQVTATAAAAKIDANEALRVAVTLLEAAGYKVKIG